MSSEEEIGVSRLDGERVLRGLPVSRGCAVGTVRLLSSGGQQYNAPERRIEAQQVEQELTRLADAFSAAHAQVTILAQNFKKHNNGDGEDLTIFDGHLMMLEDSLLIEACNEKVSEELCSAETAVKQVTDSYLTIFEAMSDSCLRERAQDIKDIAKRLLDNLHGKNENLIKHPSHPCIVVAEEISPSDTISLPPEMILGIATERGSTTSHASLLARALGMPAVVGVKGLIKSVADGDIIMLDGSIGTITLNPDARSCAEVKKMMRGHLTDGDDAAHKTPGAMRDGHAVPLLANVDSSTPLVRLHASGAEGIGLYRTEYLWFKGNREPDEAEQTHAYTEIAKAMSNNGTVTIRVLDVGGDKTLTGDAAPHHEANPFLGNRSIRYLLNNVEVFRRQLRAILRASAHGRVRIMYPMIATIEELRAANAELRVCMEQMRAEGVAFDAAIQCGVMIEIPAAALIAEALANECDFFSIGTNDLIQYTLAVDRGNASVAQLYQPAHHAVLRLIEMSVKAAHERGLKVSVCGEMAADPAMAVLLVGLGVDALSMSPNLIGGVREVLSCVTLGEAIDLAGAVMALLDATGGAGYEYCTATVGALRARIVSGG